MNSPFPSPTHPTMYRASGLVRGRYQPGEALTKGVLTTDDGLEFPVTLMGTVGRFLQKHPELLENQQIWGVWPRTFPGSPGLFFEVWALKQGKDDEERAILDNGVNTFSIRGIIVYQEGGKLAICIKRNLKPVAGKEQERRWHSFTIVIDGFLPEAVVGQFWELECLREGGLLMMLDGQFVADMNTRKSEPKRKSKLKKSKATPKPKLKKKEEAAISK